MEDSLTLDLGDSAARSKHERLHNYFMTELISGRLRPGDALPTEKELTRAANISRNTVRQALGELARKGLIQRTRGRGSFVHESALIRLKSGLDAFGLVIPETRTGFYPSLQRGFNAAAAALNNQVIVCDTDNDTNKQASALLQLMDKKIAGIAIVPTTTTATPPHHIRPLQAAGIPVVFCHRRVEGIQAPLITFSAKEVGRLAGRAFLKFGHRRVAMFSHTRGGLAPLYEKGLRDEMEGGGYGLAADFVRCDDAPRFTSEHESWVATNLKQIMTRPDRPTAIFCTFDAEAELVFLLLGKLGYRVPDDVSIVSFGGRWREGAIARRLVSVTVDEEQLAAQTVKLLDEMRHKIRALDDATELLMQLELSAGETLAKASG